MTSGKQVEADQRNARLSTGPKTPEGKRVVARNATRLGLWSKDVVMAGEDQDEFDEFEEGFLDEVNPVGAVETWLAHEVVASAWRLRRVRRVEAEILAEQSFAEKDSVPTLGRAYLNDCRGLNALSKLARDESRIERAMCQGSPKLTALSSAKLIAPLA